MKALIHFKTLFITIFIILGIKHQSDAQKADSLVKPNTSALNTFTTGAITVTNNGLSLIPTFSLGKPAYVFDLSVRRRRLSFDPQLRFAVKEFKPWSFVFWMRYRLIDAPKFKMSLGTHPSVVFAYNEGVTTIKRYFAGELTPSYKITKNISLGIYYLYSRGLASPATLNTNYIGTLANFNNIKLLNSLKMKIVPQIYFLKMDQTQGTYVTSTFQLSSPKSPFSLQSVINKKIKSTIPSKDVVSNVSLIYAF